MNLNDIPEEFSLPTAPEAEAGVLSAILLDNNAFDNVADLLTADSFHDERAGIAFGAIASLVMAGKPADVLTVHELVGSRGITLLDLNQFAQAASSASIGGSGTLLPRPR